MFVRPDVFTIYCTVSYNVCTTWCIHYQLC